LGSSMSHYLTKKKSFFSLIGLLHVPLFDKKEIFYFSLIGFMSHYLIKKKSFFSPHWVPPCPTIWQKRNLFFPSLGSSMSHYLTKKKSFFFPYWVHVSLFDKKEISVFSPHWVHVPLFDKKKSLFSLIGFMSPPPSSMCKRLIGNHQIFSMKEAQI
jgi:hypothetical protein